MNTYTGTDTADIWNWRVAPAGRDEAMAEFMTVNATADKKMETLGMTKREKVSPEQKREYARLYAQQYRQTDRCKETKALYREQIKRNRREQRILNPLTPKPVVATYAGMTPEQTAHRRKLNTQWMRMKRAAERINKHVPRRTQADVDRTRSIVATSNWNRSA